MNKELEHLDYVISELHEEIQVVKKSMDETQKDIASMHEYYWENYTEMDQYGYENFDNQQALMQQVNSSQEQQIKYHRLKKLLKSPYFGRFDFIYDGDEEAEVFYIGIGNFSRDAGLNSLIYDWRAPVCSLYYDYDKGPAEYEAPLGVLSGELSRKRQFKIRDGRMIYGLESDIKIDDDILREELSGTGDVHLKNIIRTIQKEQNSIIRNTKDPIMVIQGAAGSGKTSIALHRIAYLLYHDRNNLKSSNVLILSPNTVFSDYISQILPELGEENIQEMSFDIFAYKELKGLIYDCEDRYDQIEKEIRDPKETGYMRIKQSDDFLNDMEEYLLLLEDSLMNFRDFHYKSYEKEEKEIIRLFYNTFMNLPLLSRMDAMIDYAKDEYETLRGSDLSEEEEDLFRTKFHAMYQTMDLYELYRRFLKEYGYREIPRVVPEKRILRYEDVYPLLYLKYRLQDRAHNKRIRHLVIDEMQDYSKLQYLILQILFPCKMTIVGDRAQSLNDQETDVTKFLPGIFGKNLRMLEMKKSYRNTVEIAEYAAAITGVKDLELFERHGKAVEERKFGSLREAADAAMVVLRENAEQYETAAILCMDQEDAFAVAQILKKKLPENQVHYIDKNTVNFKKGLTVTTYYLAKGLEFDRVAAITRKENQNGLYRQAEYICATRAMHELYMFDVENK